MTQTIAPTEPDPRAGLVQTLLEEGQEALNSNNLAEAQSCYEEALGVTGHHPDRARVIRDTLKRYSDAWSNHQEAPKWELAHHALDMLNTLKLADEESQAWLYNLKLKQACYLLEQGAFDESFKLFTGLMANAEQPDVQRHLKANIVQMLRNYISRQTTSSDWTALRQLLERLQAIWEPGDELHDWPEIISRLLAAVDQKRRGEDQRLTEINRRSRNFTTILFFIFFLAIVAYTYVLLFP